MEDFSRSSQVLRRLLLGGMASLLTATEIMSMPPVAHAELPQFLQFGRKPDIPETPSRGFQTKSGLKYFDLVKSEVGNTPRYGQLVSFKYNIYYRPFDGDGKLRLIDSTDFDPKKEPYMVQHGNGRTIRGIEEGIHTMHLGSKRRFIIPPNLGYNQIALGPIPMFPSNRRELNEAINKVEANQGELFMDIEIVMIADDEADPGYYDDETVSPEELSKYITEYFQNAEFQKNMKSLEEESGNNQVIPERK